MKRPSARIAFEIAPSCVRAVALRPGDALACAQREIGDGGVTDALGALAKELGVTGNGAVVCLSRTDTVLKTIPLPPGGLPDHERPSFVRLQMDRQLPFPSEQAVIDFVGAPHAEPSILAAAVRKGVVQRAVEGAKGAGFRTPVVSLLDEGLARLLAPVGERGEGVVGVFVSEGRCEIVIARDGRLLLSRACDLPEDINAAHETVVTEARRTLMSYRVRQDGVPVRTGGVLCEASEEIALRAALEPALELGAIECIETGANVGCPSACARLAGSLSLGEGHLDFASPTAPPDRFARVRQLAMLAVLLVIMVVGGLVTMGLREKRALTDELDSKQAEVASANKRALSLIRGAGRLAHAEAWVEAGVDWPAHLAYVARMMPPDEEMLLDRMIMGADHVVDYDNKGGRAYSDERWGVGADVVISVGVRAQTPEILRSLRERLIALDTYTLTPIGEDTGGAGEGPYPFVSGATLRSKERAPEIDAAEAGETGE